MKFVLLGVGNTLKGDDGLGSVLAQEFTEEGWKVCDGSTAPEAYTSVIRREEPEVLVIVDAAELGTAAGEIRCVPKEKIDESVVTTHGMPLSFLITQVEKHCGEIFFVGVQPKSTEEFEDLSKEARWALEKIKKQLREKNFSFTPL